MARYGLRAAAWLRGNGREADLTRAAAVGDVAVGCRRILPIRRLIRLGFKLVNALGGKHGLEGLEVVGVLVDLVGVSASSLSHVMKP